MKNLYLVGLFSFLLVSNVYAAIYNYECCDAASKCVTDSVDAEDIGQADRSINIKYPENTCKFKGFN